MTDGTNLCEEEPEYVPGPPREELMNALTKDKHYLPFRLVLEFGTDYDPAVMPDGVEEGQPRCCFNNAYELARASDWALQYAEGYACLDGAWIYPSRHGWCIDDEDCVVDPTWGTTRKLPLALRGVVLPPALAEPFCGEFTSGALEGLADLGRFDEVLYALGVSWPDG